MRQLLPHPVESIGVDEIAALYAYPDAGAVRANMVTSLDGAVTADGRSAVISGPPDTFMFGVLRSLADVIVVGAGTARTEGYGPGRARAEFAHLRRANGQPPAPAIALVTLSAELDPTAPLFTDALQRCLVITCDAAPSDRRKALSEVADVLVTGDETVQLEVALAELRRRGMGRILTEGGPRLLGDLAAQSLVDELALSLSPLIAGGDAGRILTTGSPVLEPMALRVLLEEDAFLFGLYETQGKETSA
jgi:riboflavin biosynthesis pyrimidine reductase